MSSKLQALGGLALITALVSACSGGGVQMGNVKSLQMVRADEFPQPTIADMSASSRPFRLGPFDVLNIDVYGAPELSQKEVQVDASGRITFPLIGTVEVAGRTPGEVAQAMQDRFRSNFIKNPQITVNLKESVSQTVTIGGQVKKPGVYPIVGKMTLLKAVASAEGWTEFSKKREVVVIRTVGGQEYAALYDVKSIERGIYSDPEIFANDTVMVGDSKSQRIFKDFLAASPLLAPLVILLDNNN